jgi:hypothetical protein
MALNSISYITVGYTETDNASVRKGYPIKQLFKQTVNTNTPVFPASYTPVSTQKYWLPFLSGAQQDFNFIEYTVGDEYGWNDADNLRAPQIPYSNPKTTKYDDFVTGHKIVFANNIYVATQYTFEWGLTKFKSNTNPYKQSRIKKWRKFNDTDDDWSQYWYHPLLKLFFLLDSTDAIAELPNFDEASQSKWDNFVGDSTDMNLENFDLAQIRELTSGGTSNAAATSLVASLSTRNNNFASTYIVNTAVKAKSATISVLSPTQTVKASSKPESPKMIQRRAISNSTEKTVLDEYEFNLRPNNISYSNIGITWTEIERLNNYGLVDYKNNKLMKISFEFVVEAHSGDKSSIYESCEDKLAKLQRMANTPELVIFRNFDSLFSGSTAVIEDKSYREWAIFDMSISSIQRTPLTSVSDGGSISRATVNMTIQEVRLSPDNVIFMPKLRKVPNVPNAPGGTPDPELCTELATDSSETARSGGIKLSPCWYKNRGMAVPAE